MYIMYLRERVCVCLCKCVCVCINDKHLQGDERFCSYVFNVLSLNESGESNSQTSSIW